MARDFVSNPLMGYYETTIISEELRVVQSMPPGVR